MSKVTEFLRALVIDEPPALSSTRPLQQRKYLTLNGIKHWSELTKADCLTLRLDWNQVKQRQALLTQPSAKG